MAGGTVELRIIKSRNEAMLAAAKRRKVFWYERRLGYALAAVSAFAALAVIAVPLLTIATNERAVQTLVASYVSPLMVILVPMIACVAFCAWTQLTQPGQMELQHATRMTAVFAGDESCDTKHLSKDAVWKINNALLYGFGERPMRFAFMSSKMAYNAILYLENLHKTAEDGTAVKLMMEQFGIERLATSRQPVPLSARNVNGSDNTWWLFEVGTSSAKFEYSIGGDEAAKAAHEPEPPTCACHRHLAPAAPSAARN